MREKYLEYLKEQKLEKLVNDFENNIITFEEMVYKAMDEHNSISFSVFVKRIKMDKFIN